MELLNLVALLRGETRLYALADEIAQRSLEDSWKRAGQRALVMTPAEARGYIRARAASVVHRETELAARQWIGLTRDARVQLLELATDALLELTLQRIRELRLAAIIRRRAA